MSAEGPSWKDILLPQRGWASLAVAPESAMDDFAAASPSNATARIVRARRCLVRATLFQEWAAALQFPAYFGENWDAFEECMADREWLPGKTHVVIVTQTQSLLENERAERATLLRILSAVAREPGERSLRLIFHCEPDHVPATRALLEECGIRI